VSAAFPAVMDLKFERVCQPFMMLHVNRYLHPAPRLPVRALAISPVTQAFGLDFDNLAIACER
jgi:hypothetical protein